MQTGLSPEEMDDHQGICHFPARLIARHMLVCACGEQAAMQAAGKRRSSLRPTLILTVRRWHK